MARELEGISPNGQTILLIDNRPDIAAVVTTSLVEQGYRIISADNPTAGLERVISEQPDMLILGLALPDAFEMLQHLQGDPRIPRLPVIALLNSWAQETDIRKGWDLGIDAYLPVQFHPEELRDFVRRIFRSIDEDRDVGARWSNSPA